MKIFAAGKKRLSCRTPEPGANRFAARPPALNRISGNVFFALFAAVAMVGGVGYGFNTVLRGPMTSMTEVTRRTVAESTIVTSSRMAIVGATTQQANADCDTDGMVEPLQFRVPGAGLPAPTGGGYLPAGLVPDSIDPWSTEYGYCSWDSGSVTLHASCGSPARRLAGAPNNRQYAVAIISAGKDKKFQTTCVAYNGATPNASLITNVQGSDDIVLGYSYAEAIDLGAGMWKVNAADPTVAETRNALEVEQGGTFTNGVVLQGNTLTGGGLRLPDDPGNDSRTGACNTANDKQIRRNTGTVPPSLEICNFSGGFSTWQALSGGSSGGGGGSTTSSAIAQWKLDETSGTTAEDSVGNADGTLYNSASFQPTGGYSGGAALFDRALGSYIRIPRSAAFETTAFTASMWVKRTSNDSSLQTLFRKTYQNNTGPTFASYSAGYMTGSYNGCTTANAVCFYTGRTGGVHGLTGATALPLNQWVHVVISYDPAGTAPQKKIYINGVLDGSATVTDPIIYDTTATGDLYMGKEQSSGSESYGGSLDDVRFYNYQMSDAEVLAVYNGSGAQIFKNKAPEKAGRAMAWGNGQNSRLGNGGAANQSFPVPVLYGGNVTQLALAEHHGCALKAGGKVWCWGLQDYGRLGDGITSGTRSSPQPITTLSDVVKITDANRSTCALKRDGTVWCWGIGDFGQLGQGDTTWRSVPTKIASLGNVIDVEGGSFSYCAVTRDGGGHCWGRGSNGRLGNGDTLDSLVPVPVSNITNFTKIRVSKSGSHACGITRVGDAYCWGNNSNGQLGNNSTTQSTIPARVTTNTGSGFWTDWVDFAPASSYTCGVRANGTAWCWGSDAYGSLGNGAAGSSILPSQVVGYTDFVKIASADGAVCGIRKNGDVLCWGSDSLGMLGNGPNVTANFVAPQLALINNAYDVFSAVSGFAVLTDTDKRPIPLDASRPSRVKAGTQHSCALDRDNSVWCWGDNAYSQLGIGVTGGANRDVPMRVPGTWSQLATTGVTDFATCAVRNDGEIYCWGDDTRALMGNGGGGNQNTPGIISSTGPWSQVAVSISRACAIKSTDGSLWCWGTNLPGALIQTPAAIASTDNTRYRQIALVHNLAVCGITVSDEILCTGSASGGLLGNGQTSGQYTEAKLLEPGPWQSISGGGTHYCAIKQDGSMWCWGYDSNGQYGSYGSHANPSVPWPVSEPGPWAKVSAGDQSTCALKVDGSAWCWGNNNSDRLGSGLGGGSYNYPVRVIGDGFVDISVGSLTACGMKKDDTVWCWGGDVYENLGNGPGTSSANRPVKVSGLPHREPWWVNVNGYNNDLLPGLNVDIGTRSLSSGGATGDGFNFAGTGRSQLTSPQPNNFTVESVGLGGDAQISLKAAGAKGVRAMPPGMIAWWRMEETTGTAVYDTVGGNNGTWTGSPAVSSAPGRVGNALNFTAGSTFIDLGTAPGLTSNYPVTVALWVYPRTNNCNGGYGICSVMYAMDNDGGVAGGWYLSLAPGTRQIRVGGEWPFVDLYTTQTVPLNSWTHIVYAWSPPDLPKIYLNGVPATLSSPPASTIRPEDVGTPKAIGSAHGGGNQWNVDGLLDEVQVYNRVLSATEVSQIYNATSSTSFVEVIRSFGMDYASGNFKIARNATGANSWLGELSPDLEINALGDVGVGTGGSPQAKLDVNGGLKVGNDGGACNAGKAGAMQWTGTLMQYCDGTGSWKTFGVGGASTVLWDTRKEAMQSPYCALRTNGTMWCWGDDWDGALGRNTNNLKSLAPVATHSDSSSTGWTDWIAASGSCGLRSSGTMWCWGNGTRGRLGNNSLSSALRPVQVRDTAGSGSWSDWKALGKHNLYDTACGIRANGVAYCWGRGTEGQLGNGTNTANQATPVEVHTNASSPGWSDWLQLASDTGHTCGVRANGTAWCWGTGSNGRLGDNTNNARTRPVQVLNNSGGAGWTDWKYVSVGENLSCGLRRNGTVWCWGGPAAGKGEGSGAISFVPVQFSSNCGNTFTDIVAMDTSGYHTCVIRANGSLWCAGSGFSGGVGVGDTNDYYCPVQVKDSTGTTNWYDWVNVVAQDFGTCGTRSNGQYYCWGGTAFDDYGRYLPVRMK